MVVDGQRQGGLARATGEIQRDLAADSEGLHGHGTKCHLFPQSLLLPVPDAGDIIATIFHLGTH